MTALVQTGTPQRTRQWNAVIAASIGNALEWFDFVVYGFFAITIARLFFPAADEGTSLLVALATFGVTYFMRPLGAIVLGDYADRHGRKAAFSLSIVLMTLGTGIIALAPTYAAIGLWAPILIVLARCIQGFSAGGEFGAATAFLAEQHPERRGFFASWQFASQGLTTVLATAFGAVLAGALSVEQMDSWGWRIPFLFGLLIGPVGYYLRSHVEETAEFRSTHVRRAPLREAFLEGKKRLLISFGAVVLCTVAMYTILFLPTYAVRQLGLPASGSFLATLLNGSLQMVLIPVVGAWSDRHGRLPLTFCAAIALLVGIYPLFAWLAAAPTLGNLLIFQAVIGVLAAGYMGALPAHGGTLPNQHADDRFIGCLFLWGRSVRRLCACDQCVAYRSDGKQPGAEFLPDGGGAHKHCSPGCRTPAGDTLSEPPSGEL
jgi:MFS transporter, MHS family, proline/betaine transporter